MANDNPVAERVHALLTERGLAPGDRLPSERDLAAALGIARSSLREGVRRLVDLGILEARRGSGTYLAAVDLLDLLEVRLRLEPFAASLAAQRRTPGHLTAMDALFCELRVSQPDPVAFARVDLRLHEVVIDAAASPSLRVLDATLADLLRHSRATTSSDTTLRAATVACHEQLLSAIHARDASAAERAMRGHLSDVIESARRQGA